MNKVEKKKNGMSHSLIHSTLQSTKVKCVLFMSIICNFFNNAVCLKTKYEHTPKKRVLIRTMKRYANNELCLMITFFGVESTSVSTADTTQMNKKN